MDLEENDKIEAIEFLDEKSLICIICLCMRMVLCTPELNSVSMPSPSKSESNYGSILKLDEVVLFELKKLKNEVSSLKISQAAGSSETHSQKLNELLDVATSIADKTDDVVKDDPACC